MADSILAGQADFYAVTPDAHTMTGTDTHRLVFTCRGCSNWQIDIEVEDLDNWGAAEELGRHHFDECEPLRRADSLNAWWHHVATRDSARDRAARALRIGDLLEQLRPLAEWHSIPESPGLHTIAKCRFCDWQTDAPTAAEHPDRACLYALNEHRSECRTLDTMAALRA